jgi:hypothetical protein
LRTARRSPSGSKTSETFSSSSPTKTDHRKHTETESDARRSRSKSAGSMSATCGGGVYGGTSTRAGLCLACGRHRKDGYSPISRSRARPPRSRHRDSRASKRMGNCIKWTFYSEWPRAARNPLILSRRSGHTKYLQIVRTSASTASAHQSVVAALGRVDNLAQDGTFDQSCAPAHGLLTAPLCRPPNPAKRVLSGSGPGRQDEHSSRCKAAAPACGAAR